MGDKHVLYKVKPHLIEAGDIVIIAQGKKLAGLGEDFRFGYVADTMVCKVTEPPQGPRFLKEAESKREYYRVQTDKGKFWLYADQEFLVLAQE